MSLADAFAPKPPPKILTIDIERLPGLAPVFDQRTDFIPVYKWRRMPATICFAAKWHHRRVIEFRAAWDAEDGHAAMVRRSWELYDQADYVVTYNGRKFDNKHLRGQWMLAGLPEPTPWRDVDLYVQGARFGFESRSLAHLCYRLGLPGKSGHYDAEEAERAMDGDPVAQRNLKRYNMGDTRITEAVFDRLRPWIKGMNVGLHLGDDVRACPNCGHDVLEPAGFANTAVTRYPAYRCAACGAVSRGKNRAASVPMRGVTS